MDAPKYKVRISSIEYFALDYQIVSQEPNRITIRIHVPDVKSDKVREVLIMSNTATITIEEIDGWPRKLPDITTETLQKFDGMGNYF